MNSAEVDEAVGGGQEECALAAVLVALHGHVQEDAQLVGVGGGEVDRVGVAVAGGGDDLATLYITTTRENVPEGEQPDAGSVFATRPGVRGLPVAPYAG